MSEDPKPTELSVVGKPWSLIFAPYPTVPSKQGIWLFNQDSGEFWELVSNNNFVLRPRQQSHGAQMVGHRRTSARG